MAGRSRWDVLACKCAKHRELILIELFPCAIDPRQFKMSVGFRAGVSREMFATARNSLVAHRVIERTGITDNLVDRFPITSPAQRIVRVIVKRNVEHGAKIEIEPENAQQTSGDIAVTANEIDVVLVAQLLGVRWLGADQTQARHASAFLVDGDDRLGFAQIAQIVDQLSQLRRALNVAPKKNESARLHAPKHFRARRVEFLPGNAAKYELAERIILVHYGRRLTTIGHE